MFFLLFKFAENRIFRFFLMISFYNKTATNMLFYNITLCEIIKKKAANISFLSDLTLNKCYFVSKYRCCKINFVNVDVILI